MSSPSSVLFPPCPQCPRMLHVQTQGRWAVTSCTACLCKRRSTSAPSPPHSAGMALGALPLTTIVEPPLLLALMHGKSCLPWASNSRVSQCKYQMAVEENGGSLSCNQLALLLGEGMPWWRADHLHPQPERLQASIQRPRRQAALLLDPAT